MAGNSSFFYTNPTPEQTPGLLAELNTAIADTTALLSEYTAVTKTWASTVNIDWSDALTQRITLGGNTTFTFSNARDGGKYVLEITQDSTGNRIFTLPSNVRYGTYIPSVSPTITANKTDKIGFIYNSTANKYDLVAVAYGF